MLEIKEKEDFIICQLCKQKVKRIYGKHLKVYHKGMTSKEYKEKFPGYPLNTSKDKFNTSKNSGKFMKEDKWRKWASKKNKGEKNPNHKLNTTKKQRKERSPFSKEFYKKKNLSEHDRKIFIKEALNDREFDTRIEYYLKRGYSEEESKKKVKERQTTFSLEKCIKKFGEEKGLQRWKERQEKWKSKVFNKNTYIGRGTSKLSNTIISEIIKYNKNNNKLLYDNNEMFIYDNINKQAYKFDLTNKTTKKILEINGVFWHCRPTIYESSYVHKVKKMTAQEIWDYDKAKHNLAIKNNYQIFILWEDDYNKDPKGSIKRCIEFIYEKDS